MLKILGYKAKEAYNSKEVYNLTKGVKFGIILMDGIETTYKKEIYCRGITYSRSYFTYFRCRVSVLKLE